MNPDCLPKLSITEWDQFEIHFALLQKYNELAGLVSPHTVASALAVHYCDSIHMSRFIAGFVERDSLRDIGSGGGFPGIVHAVLHPQQRIRLYERNLKKRTFLRMVVGELQLSNCIVEEEAAGPSLDLLMSRATFGVESFYDSVRSLLLPEGRTVLSWGGGEKKFTEDSAFTSLGAHQYVLPGDAGRRGVEVLRFCPT